MAGELSYTPQLSPLDVRAVGLEDQVLFHLIPELSHGFLLGLSGYVINYT